MEGFVFELQLVPGGVFLFCDLVRAVVFVDRFPAATINHFGQLVFAVVFELPAQAFFGGLRDALEVPTFVRVFDDVFHRVFGAFDQAFAVVFQFDRAADRIGDRRQLACFVVRERGRVTVAIGHAFEATAAAGEFVFDLVGKGQRVAAAFRAAEGILRPYGRFEYSASFFGKRHRAAVRPGRAWSLCWFC